MKTLTLFRAYMSAQNVYHLARMESVKRKLNPEERKLVRHLWFRSLRQINTLEKAIQERLKEQP